MKKINFLIFILEILFIGCNENPTDNIFNSQSIIKKIGKDSINYTEYFYEGDLLIRKEIVVRGKLSYVTKLYYNDVDRIIREEEQSFDAGPPIFIYNEYDYNEDLLSKSRSYRKNAEGDYELMAYSIYFFENKNLVEYKTFDESDALQYRQVYNYDSDSNIIEDILYDNRDNIVSHQQYEYDTKNNPINIDQSEFSPSAISKSNFIKRSYIYYTINPPTEGIETRDFIYYKDYPKSFLSINKSSFNNIVTTDTTEVYFEYY